MMIKVPRGFFTHRSLSSTSACVPTVSALSCFHTQVQNISQSMEVLDLRTYRDLQYVRDTESLMKVVDGRLKVASENPRSLNPKGFQVSERRRKRVSTSYVLHFTSTRHF